MQPKYVSRSRVQRKDLLAMRGNRALQGWKVLAALIPLMLLPACRREAGSRPQSAVIELTDLNFKREVRNSDQVVLVEFWAPWCEPCLQMAPAIESIAEEYRGQLKVGRLHFDENEDLAEALGVAAPPAILVFRDGDVIKRRTGLQTEKDLRDLANAVLSVDSISAIQGPK